MDDIFLSYNREDQSRARLFAEGFAAEGLSVWWDVTLRSGETYDEVTERALRQAKAVVVLWSPRSVASRWVRAEATIADRNKTMVPVTIEACERPVMFELTQTADMMHWHGDTSDPVWRNLLDDVRRQIVSGRPAEHRAVADGGELLRAMATPPAPLRKTSKRPTLAVMPFTNRSGRPEDEDFGDAIAEDISIALSRGRGLSLIAHGAIASACAQDSDVRRIGAALGADYLMEGNVRRIGGTLRVSAQLLEAKTGAILWTERFDRAAGEQLELLDDLVDDVSRHIGVQIQNIEMDRASKKTANDSPWDAMKRGWMLIPRMLPEGLREAIVHARRAVELAPNLAQTEANLGLLLGLLYQRLGSRNPELLEEALQRCDRAVKLNPNHPLVLVQASLVRYYNQDWDTSLQLAERAVELNPEQADALQALGGAYTRVERYDEAIALLDRADHLAPSGFSLSISLINRCWALYGAGRLEEARDTASKILKIMPGDHTGLMLRPIFHAELGDDAAAVADMRELRRVYPDEDLEVFLGTIRTSRQADPVRQRNGEVFERIWHLAAENAVPDTMSETAT